MDTRKAMAIGGGATAVATIAVATAIAWTSAAALSDSPGAPLAAATVVVPAPKVTSSASPAPTTPTPVATPVTVPAPEPGIVDSHPSTGSGADSSQAKVKSTPSQTSSATHTSSDRTHSKWRAWERGRELAKEAVRTGDWSKVRAWAKSLGWSEQRTDTWIAECEARYGSGHGYPTAPTDQVGHQSGSEPSPDSGSKREQPPYTPN